MCFLTIDPFVGIPVFIAKLSERHYCWRVIEDFHCQEYIQFFDIHNCLFMRLHFSMAVMTIVGLHDFVKASISASLRSFLLIICIDTPESTTNSHSSGFNVDAGRRLFSEGEKNVALRCSCTLAHFWPASTQLRGHLALATLSLLVNDLQISERWGYAHEVHLYKCNRAKDFGLEFLV